MPQITAVVFDLDGTLLPLNSWSALTQALGASWPEHESIYDAYRESRIGYEQAKRRLLDLWRATGRANRECLLEIFNELPIRPEANEIVHWLKSQQYKTCLISGSMDLYVATVARRLDIDYYYANTSLLFDGTGQLIDFEYFLDQSTKKSGAT